MKNSIYPMKVTTHIKTFLYIVLLMSTNAWAQSDDTKAVTAAVEELRKALIDPTDANLNALVADELSYGHSNGKVEDKKEFKERLLSGNSDFLTIQLEEQTIKFSGNVAIVRHRLSAETKDNGVAGSAKLNVLLIWQKQEGKWKLLARQAARVLN